MKALILTEGGRQAGFGQIVRCASLDHAFRERGVNPIFIANGDETIRDILKNADLRIFNWMKNEEELLPFLKDSDIVVVDSYFADIGFYQKVSEKAKIPVFMDDTCRLDYPRGIVVNGAIHAEEMNYPSKKEVDYLLGIQYFPLRQDFWDVPPIKIRRKIKAVVVTFGGNDVRNLTPAFLIFLSKNYGEFDKNIIVGKGNSHLEEIQKAADRKTRLFLNPGADDLKKAILDSDVAISASGQTLYELVKVGIPTIAIQVIENQAYNIMGLTKVRAIEYAGRWEDKKILQNVKLLINKLECFDIRKNMSLIGKKLIDGNGSHHIVQKIINLIGSLPSCVG